MNAPITLERICVVGAGSIISKKFLQSFSDKLASNSALSQIQLILIDEDSSRFHDIRQWINPKIGFAVKSISLGNDTPTREALSQCGLMINTAGPYHTTCREMMEICIQNSIHYIDINQDAGALKAAGALSQKAIDAGISMCIGCNTTPGASSLMVIDLLDQVVEASMVRTFYSIHSTTLAEQNQMQLSQSQLTHILRSGVEDFETIQGKRTQTISPYGTKALTTDVDNLDGHSYYEVASAEPEVVAKDFPKVQNMQAAYSIYPLDVMAAMRGISGGIKSGALSYENALTYLQSAGQKGAVPAEILGVVKKLIQQGNDAVEADDTQAFGTKLANAIGSLFSSTPEEEDKHFVLCAEVYGKDLSDEFVKVRKRIRMSPKTAEILNVPSHASGTVLAGFVGCMVERLAEGALRTGVHFPHHWITPTEFYRAWAKAIDPMATEQDIVTPVQKLESSEKDIQAMIDSR